MGEPQKLESGPSHEELHDRIAKLEEKLRQEKPTPVNIIDLINRLLIPVLLAILSWVTFFTQQMQTQRQYTLQTNQQAFDRQQKLQEQYLNDLADKNPNRQSAAILTLRLMEKNDVIQLANLPAHVGFPRRQRQQIIELLCQKGGASGCPYTILEGVFTRINEGDSLSFSATTDNRGNWLNLDEDQNLPPPSSSPTVIPLAAIDAPELNFEVSGQGCLGEKYIEWGRKARARLAKLLGFVENPSKEQKAMTNPGYLVVDTSSAYGKGIAFAFPDTANLKDGNLVYIDSGLIEQSANYQLLKEGLVYPYFTNQLPGDGIKLLRSITAQAHKAKTGLWADDSSKAFKVNMTEDKINGVAFPKLLRNLCVYRGVSKDVSEFKGYVWEHVNQRVENIAGDELSSFADIFEVNGDTLSLQANPEDIVFRQ